MFTQRTVQRFVSLEEVERKLTLLSQGLHHACECDDGVIGHDEAIGPLWILALEIRQDVMDLLKPEEEIGSSGSCPSPNGHNPDAAPKRMV